MGTVETFEMNQIILPRRIARTFALLLFCSTVLFILALIHQYIFKVDFASLYAAIQQSFAGNNPYRMLSGDFLPFKNIIPVNLNPPFTLIILSPFILLPYQWALMSFIAVSTILGLWAAVICGQYFLEQRFWQTHKPMLLLFYSSMFSTLVGLAIAQLGALLFFLLMLGYDGYQKKKTLPTAFIWAAAVAFKMFPAFLLFFAIQQKRYRLALWIVAFTTIFMMLPLLVFGVDIYWQYLAMMQKVFWYSANWNASLYGLLFRAQGELIPAGLSLWSMRALWLYCIFVSILWYWNHTTLRQDPDRSFALALALMTLLSPFGWIYYFSLLMPALAYTFHKALRSGINAMLLWFAALVLINFPIDLITVWHMPDWFQRIGLFSLPCYGLLLLCAMLLFPARPVKDHHYSPDQLFWPVYMNQVLGLVVLMFIAVSRYELIVIQLRSPP